MNKRHNFMVGFISIISCVFILLLYNMNPQFLEKFIEGVHDYKFELRERVWPISEPNNKTIIVAVDEPSINQYGRWPWDRKIIADLIGKLNYASIIGLDIVFSESSNKTSDEYLTEMFAKNNNVILGYFLRTLSSVENTIEGQDILGDCAYHDFSTEGKTIGITEVPYAELNLPQFHENALSCAFFSVEPDRDGIYRKYPLAYIHNGLLLPPLAIQMMRYFYNEEASLVLSDIGIKKLSLANFEISNANYLRINYNSKMNIVSAADILSGKIDPIKFKDKLVLIGVTETGVFDIRPTPISPITPGVQIHYTVLNNILDGNEIIEKRMADNAFIVCVLMLSFLAGLLKLFKWRLFLYSSIGTSIFLYSNIVFYFFNIWHQEFYAFLMLFIATTSNEILIFRRADKQARSLKQAFSSYVSEDVVNQLIENPSNLQLGGIEKEITILFSDIRNFTRLSEQMEPKDLIVTLNKILNPLTAIVMKNDGLLDKYMGDAMMVLFNVPLDVKNHPNKAVKTALLMIDAMGSINKELSSSYGVSGIHIGIGINTGRSVIGNMGSEKRFDYTAMGDAVNIASRLEQLNKYYQTNIIISEGTRSQLDTSNFLMRQLDKIQVKGKGLSVIIYEVLMRTDENKKKVFLFEVALTEFYARNFLEASQMFDSIYRVHDDHVAWLFCVRCREFIVNPPAVEWEGVWKMQR